VVIKNISMIPILDMEVIDFPSLRIFMINYLR